MPTRQELQQYCLSLKAASLEYPFGDEAMVFKVLGKMFALVTVADPLRISLKCDPVLAGMLRDTYPAVTAGYHLNKRLWNTILIDGSIPEAEIFEWIDHSYAQVVNGLPKRERERLTAL